MRASLSALLQVFAIGLLQVLVEKEKPVTQNASSSWCFKGEGRIERGSSLQEVKWAREKKRGD